CCGPVSDPTKYRLRSILGEGVFSRVYEGEDTGKVATQTDRERDSEQYLVAIKIIKSDPLYSEWCRREVRVVKFLSQMDPHDLMGLSRINNVFTYKHHLCVISPLGPRFNLFKFIKNLASQRKAEMQQRGREMQTCVGMRLMESVRQILGLLTMSLRFIHAFGVVHSDLKPENVLYSGKPVPGQGRGINGLVEPSNDVVKSYVSCFLAKQYPDVPTTDIARYLDVDSVGDHQMGAKLRLIDYGSAFVAVPENHKDWPKRVASLFYRAPEVVLTNTEYYSPAMDIWALGCIAFELLAGRPLFHAEDGKGVLERQKSMIGELPQCLGASNRPVKRVNQGIGMGMSQSHSGSQSGISLSQQGYMNQTTQGRDQASEGTDASSLKNIQMALNKGINWGMVPEGSAVPLNQDEEFKQSFMELSSFIGACLRMHPERRDTARQLMTHPFLRPFLARMRQQRFLRLPAVDSLPASNALFQHTLTGIYPENEELRYSPIDGVSPTYNYRIGDRTYGPGAMLNSYIKRISTKVSLLGLDIPHESNVCYPFLAAGAFTEQPKKR
ncbi:hypothetical protein KIPB_004983, partial [Kipferlia bialata]